MPAKIQLPYILKKVTLSFLVVVLISLFLSCSDSDNEAPSVLYTVQVTAGTGGSTDFTSGEYEAGTNITINASPEPGYVFDGWTGVTGVTDPTLTVEVTGDLNIVAKFKLNIVALNSNVPYIVEELVDDSGYILAIENGGTTCYLIDHEGNKLKTWTFTDALGQDVELLPDGTLMGLFKKADATIGFGGQSGLIRQIDQNNNVIWEYVLSSDTEITHHDLEVLPNGNVLVLVWERITNAEAQEQGFQMTSDVFPEKLVEINPATDAIVWEWRSWEHIVQNVNPDVDTFGDPETNKHKINILYNDNSTTHPFIANGDIMHANGLNYLPERDLIALSINFYSEVWLIDHSTTTAEAGTGTGGTFNRGGDLVYRFGNQKVYGNPSASAVLDFNHHPTFINNDGQLSVLIFNNNDIGGQSRAMEFLMPALSASTDPGQIPDIIFDFSDPDLFFPRVGSAQRLPNGNTLICEGDYGFWEVNASGQIVWKYDGLGINFWRSIFYAKNSSGIQSLGGL